MVISEENILVHLWRLAVLNNVVRLTRNYAFGQARRADDLRLARRKVIKKLTDPGCSICQSFMDHPPKAAKRIARS